MPKANNLKGDYCQTCAETLDAHQREPKDVIVLDPECLKIFKETGDYDTLCGAKKDEPKPSLTEKVRSKVKAVSGD